MHTRNMLPYAIGLLACLSATTANATIILDSFSGSLGGANAVHLTDEVPAGATLLDWVKWGANTTSIGSTIYAERTGGTALGGLAYIDNVGSSDTTYGPAENAGREQAGSRWTMSWTDGGAGSSPHDYGTRTETANSDFGGGAAPNLGEGFSFTTTASSTLTHVLRLYVANFEANTTFRFTAPGASTVTQNWNSTSIGGGSSQQAAWIQVSWTPENVSDVLTTEYWSTAFPDPASGGFANISVHAAQVSTIIPEPGSLVLVGLALASLLFFRRRS